MKSNRKIKIIILIILGILLAFSPILTANPSLIARDRDITSNDYDEFNQDNLKNSAVSGKIHIDGNSGWVAFKNAGNCTGEGTYSQPYVIEDLVIDGGGYENCILIENSNVYFKIKNCSVYNSRNLTAGIRLQNVNNSQLIENYCTSNHYGIYLRDSNNNTISGNTANDNAYIGFIPIELIYTGLTIRGDNNIISGNTANNNQYGIYLYDSNYNIVSGNTLIGNNVCIVEDNCQGNTFSNNGACTYGQSNIISGYSFFFLFGIIPVVLIILSKKAKKS